ncbi:class V aminotransferase [Kutzneria sp. CA-103260]|nr:class V aminotransferase [Kutzneria sp. CA-103260]
MAVTPARFRALFPALRSSIWLDTPGSPPAARPVTAALRDVLDDWDSGSFSWINWDGAADRARTRFASYLGVDAGQVAAVGSVAEAAATVARSVPPGRVVVPEQEFRSASFPWYERHEVVTVAPRDGVTRTEDLIDALDERCRMLVVSAITSRDGQRLDLAALRAASDAVGAQMFIDLTQSLGVLAVDDDTMRADYLAVHGYKWMLAPRGAAWLVARTDRCAGLRPLAANWHSTTRPLGYFGGPPDLAPDASRCDASPAWFAWLGAVAALDLLRTLPAARVQRHCVDLAQELVRGAAEFGMHPLATTASHIVVFPTRTPDRIAAELVAAGVRATVSADRVRFGVHYFNEASDIDSVLAALRRAH